MLLARPWQLAWPWARRRCAPSDSTPCHWLALRYITEAYTIQVACMNTIKVIQTPRHTGKHNCSSSASVTPAGLHLMQAWRVLDSCWKRWQDLQLQLLKQQWPARAKQRWGLQIHPGKKAAAHCAVLVLCTSDHTSKGLQWWHQTTKISTQCYNEIHTCIYVCLQSLCVVYI